MTAASSNDGEFATSITTDAPATASGSPSPVSELTPVFGAAATTSWPCSERVATTFAPISPVPPTTTIFMGEPLCARDPLVLHLVRHRRLRLSTVPRALENA